MRETEVRVLNRLHQSPEAVVQVMIRPRFSTAALELHPLRILNPGPNGGGSSFLFRGEWSVAVRGARGATRAFTPLLPGEVVRLVNRGRRMRLEPGAMRLSGGRIGVHHLLDAPRLVDVEWLVDETVVARARGVHQGSLVSASFDEDLWIAAVLAPNIGDVERALSNATRFAAPPQASRLLIDWDRVGGIGGRDVFLGEAC